MAEVIGLSLRMTPRLMGGPGWDGGFPPWSDRLPAWQRGLLLSSSALQQWNLEMDIV